MRRSGVLATALPLLALAASLRAADPPSKAPAVSTASTVIAPAQIAASLRPDLRVTVKPNDGVGPMFNFVISNVGKVEAKESTIQFWVQPPCDLPGAANFLGSGKLIKSDTIKALIPTTSPQYAFGYSFQMPPQLRGCAIKVVVDADHHVAELDETNNEVVLQTHLPPAPDLVPDVWHGEYQYKVWVWNRGTAAAGPSVLQVSCTNRPETVGFPCDPEGKTASKTWTYNVPSIAPGQSYSVDSPVSDYYKKLLYVVVDKNHQVPELNENNNVWAGYDH